MDNVKDRIRKFNNIILVAYLQEVQHEPKENDPNGEAWQELIEHAEKNQSEYFDSYGDFKDKYVVKEQN